MNDEYNKILEEYQSREDEEASEEFFDRKNDEQGEEMQTWPTLVRDFANSATEVSHYNGVPAALSLLTVVGQVCKDFVHIPNGRTHEDSRLHFCWVQTSGTGKSTLWNFVGPVSKKAFQLINQKNVHPPRVVVHKEGEEEEHTDIIPSRFDTFSVTDYTDAVLIGKWVLNPRYDYEDDENIEPEYNRRAGILEGNGLAHWDEFEYSGIFKQSNHQEKAVVYLNTLMNSLNGNNWWIAKALDSMGGKIMHCYCERSVLAMTYPPNNINEVIADKGVLQRMLLYIKDVPEYKQDEMVDMKIANFGKIVEVNQPIDEFAEKIFEIYEMMYERWNAVNRDPLQTVIFEEGFNRALALQHRKMKMEIRDADPHVVAALSNFKNRLLNTLGKVAVLCAIIESPSRPPQDRFVVRATNAWQAGTFVQKSYSTLMEWLRRSLKAKRLTSTENNYEPIFLDCYNAMKEDWDENGYVNKTKFLNKVMTKVKKSRAQVYRNYDIVRHNFHEMKEGRSWYIKQVRRDEK